VVLTLERGAHALGDRGDVSSVAPGRDDEVVGVSYEIGDLEDRDVVSLLFNGDPGDQVRGVRRVDGGLPAPM